MSFNSRLIGYISIGCGILSFLGLGFLLFLAVIFTLMFDPKSWSSDSIQYYFYFTIFINLCILCMSFAGLVSGIFGLVSKNNDKMFAGIGIGINILPFIGELVFFAIFIAGYFFSESVKTPIPSLPKNIPSFKR